MPDTNVEDFDLALARLVADPSFRRLEELEKAPNLFRTLGRTFTETWHSAFLAWLLNPEESHGLRAFPLIRFLVTTCSASVAPSESAPDYILGRKALARLAISRKLEDAGVLIWPNAGAGEKEIGSGRVDVWVECLLESVDGQKEQFFCFIEQKVNASLSTNQAAKYADHLGRKSEGADPNVPVRGICVFLSPRVWEDGDTSGSVVKDPRWYCLGYQALYDGVLQPCLEHPDVDPEMRVVISHYMASLSSPREKGNLAMSTEERELAAELHNKYKDVLERLATALTAIGDARLSEALEAADPGQSPLQIDLAGGDSIVANNVPDLLKQCLATIHRRGCEDKLEMPMISSFKRYILAREPRHPEGNNFKRAVKYDSPNGPIFVEVNRSRPDGIRTAVKLLRSVGIEVVSTSDG